VNLTPKRQQGFCIKTPDRVFYLQAIPTNEPNTTLEYWTQAITKWTHYIKYQEAKLNRRSYMQPGANPSGVPSIQEALSIADNIKLLNQHIEDKLKILTQLQQQLSDASEKFKQRTHELINQQKEQILSKKEQLEKKQEELKVIIEKLQNSQQTLKEEQIKWDNVQLRLARKMELLYIAKGTSSFLESTIESYQQEIYAKEDNIRSLTSEQSPRLTPARRTGNASNKELQYRMLKDKVEKQTQLNRGKQLQNGRLAREMQQIINDSEVKQKAKSETINHLQHLYISYKSSYLELQIKLLEQQGAEKLHLDEFQDLREKYLQALILKIKLQSQMTGTTIQFKQITFADLYEDAIGVPVQEWETWLPLKILV